MQIKYLLKSLWGVVESLFSLIQIFKRWWSILQLIIELMTFILNFLTFRTYSLLYFKIVKWNWSFFTSLACTFKYVKLAQSSAKDVAWSIIFCVGNKNSWVIIIGIND